MKIRIEACEKDTAHFIEDQLVDFNRKQLPFTQTPEFYTINRSALDENDNVLGGMIAIAYCWNILYVDILWVHEQSRGNGIGKLLLESVEAIAKEKGITMIHLDTFEFQAKDFYEKHGYQVFGVLEGYPNDIKRYYLKKDL